MALAQVEADEDEQRKLKSEAGPDGQVHISGLDQPDDEDEDDGTTE